jgi:hypothetical protein
MFSHYNTLTILGRAKKSLTLKLNNNNNNLFTRLLFNSSSLVLAYLIGFFFLPTYVGR